MMPGGTGGTGGTGGRRARGAAAALTALAPVRAHLLATAAAEADRIRAAAHTQADELIRQARLAAERAVDDGAARGVAEAAPLAAAARRHGKAQARAVVLAAQREAYDALCQRIRAEADTLRGDPGYGLLLDRLAALATQEAGPGATVTAVPAGGVVARSGQVTVDCSLPRLAAAAAESLGDRVQELWEP